MEVQTKTITKTKEGAEIKATADEVKPLIDKAYEEFRSEVEIKGFRKGKAPLSMVKKMYGQTIESEAINDLINHFYKQALEEHNLQPVGEPVLKNVDYKPNGDFSFSVEYEVLPEVELQDYTSIEVEKPVQKVTEEMIDRELEGIRLNFATRSEVDAVTDTFHSLTVDIQELDEQGMAIIGKRSEDQTINLHDERYEKDFVKPLLSAEKGGEYVIKYSHDHGEHKHDVNVKAYVKKIEKIELPELTDEFVKEKFQGKFNSADELRDDVSKRIQTMFEQESSRVTRNKIADEIVKRHEFPIPEALITKVFDQMIEDIKNRMPEQKLPPDFDRNAFEAEYYTHAEWQAKWSILREKLFEAEKVTVEDADIDKQAETDAAQYGIGKEQVISFYKTNPQVQERIMHDKLMQSLESKVNVTEKEVTPDEEEQQQKSQIIQ